MTHSLHRLGPYQKEDFVWQVYHAKGINDQGVEEKLREVIEVVTRIGSVNWGDVKTGPVVCRSVEEIGTRLSVKSRLRGVFTRREQVVEFLRSLKAKDLGLSVIIAGELEEVYRACEEAGLVPHTVNYSIGIFGRTDLLPDEEILAVTSMCGHHMIAASLVKRLREEVARGRISAEEAAHKLACLCPCGIFNPVRAAKILSQRKEVRENQNAVSQNPR